MDHHLPRDHLLSLNHRKRKASTDDCPSPKSPVPALSILTDPPHVQPPPQDNLNAPRQPSNAHWLTPHHDWALSPADDPPMDEPPIHGPPMPEVACEKCPRQKRPRVDTLSSPTHHISNPYLSPRACPRRTPTRALAARSLFSPAGRHHHHHHHHHRKAKRSRASSSYSLLSSKDLGLAPSTPVDTPPTTPSTPSYPPGLPYIRIDPNSPHIPSLQPLINRHTLKELDLDAILRNPQLRHDLLFDSGLQFRPTAGRRKRDLSENYWLAVLRELESGCTCVSFDLEGKPHRLVCACAQVPMPAANPVLAVSSSLSVVTLRMPSRLRALLAEFLEVLLSVIQPLNGISTMYAHPHSFRAQMQQHAAQAAHLRAVFDPALIVQELARGLFAPAGLFHVIGAVLKSHCAPMRDAAVNRFVEVAQTCADGGQGGKADAVKAVRMCLEILELMKLDIANHQLQSLRPFLIRSSGQFELKAFRARAEHESSLRTTRQWLHAAHRDMLASAQPIPHPLGASKELRPYSAFQPNQQIYLSVIRGLVDLAFTPPAHAQPCAPPPCAAHPSSSTSHSRTPGPLPGYPETTYLDSARLAHLSRDAAETTALYMFLMLYRQLVFAEPAAAAAPIQDADLVQLKHDVRAVGAHHVGAALLCACAGASQHAAAGAKCADAQRDIVLLVATRAQRARTRRAAPSSSSSSPLPSAPDTPPDARTLALAESWAATNMRAGSPLSTLLRTRLRDAVLGAVLAAARAARDGRPADAALLDVGAPHALALGGAPAGGGGSGMEPLAEEVRALAERLARLALIHLNAYLPLYEQMGLGES